MTKKICTSLFLLLLFCGMSFASDEKQEKKEEVVALWKTFTTPEKQPVKAIIRFRDNVAPGIKDSRDAQMENDFQAIDQLSLLLKEGIVGEVKKNLLDKLVSPIDLSLPEIADISNLPFRIENYFALEAISKGADIREAWGGMFFNTNLESTGNRYDYKRYEKILQSGNQALMLNYLGCLKQVFRYNGYTQDMEELRPLFNEKMPESDLKQEIIQLYDYYYPLRQGAPAPAFQLKDYRGNEYTLNDFYGKVLVVDVWATWCGGCIAKLPVFLEIAEKYKQREDIEFITISIDDEGAYNSWKYALPRYKLTGLKNLFAPRSQTDFSEQYNITGIPRYFIIDRNGLIVTVYAPGPGEQFEALINQTLEKEFIPGTPRSTAVKRQEVNKRKRSILSSQNSEKFSSPVKDTLTGFYQNRELYEKLAGKKKTKTEEGELRRIENELKLYPLGQKYLSIILSRKVREYIEEFNELLLKKYPKQEITKEHFASLMSPEEKDTMRATAHYLVAIGWDMQPNTSWDMWYNNRTSSEEISRDLFRTHLAGMLEEGITQELFGYFVSEEKNPQRNTILENYLEWIKKDEISLSGKGKLFVGLWEAFCRNKPEEASIQLKAHTEDISKIENITEVASLGNLLNWLLEEADLEQSKTLIEILDQAISCNPESLIALTLKNIRNNFEGKVILLENEQYNFTLRGEIEGVKYGKAFLMTTGNDSKILFTSPLENGKFEIRGQLHEAGQFIVKVNRRQCYVFLDGEDMLLKCPYESLKSEYLSGSPANDLSFEYGRIAHQQFFAPQQEKLREYQEFREKGDEKNAGKKLSEALEMEEVRFQLTRDFVSRHPDNIFSAYISDLVKGESYEKGEALFKLLTPANQASYFGRELKKHTGLLAVSAIGRPAPTFTVVDESDREVSNEEVKGRLVILDFWASWCGPCREEMKYLKELYREFKANGLQLMSISLDDSREKWLNACEEEQIPWISAWDEKGWKKSEIRTQFGIQSIPFIVLLDEEGRIISKNIRREPLRNKIIELLKQTK